MSTASTSIRPGTLKVSPFTGHPLDDVGQLIEPEARFHDWDLTPHAIFIVGAAHVKLGDVLMGTHQVDGIGRANQRGAEAFRFDLDYVVAPSIEATARLIVPIDQQVEIKRYDPSAGGHLYARVQVPGYPAGLVVDFGSNVAQCACNGGPDTDEPGSTMCDNCIDSWGIDHDIVRHNEGAIHP